MCKFHKLLLGWVIVSLVVNCGLSARILAIVSTPSFSHQIALRPIWKALALRGHNITLITTDPDPNLKVTQIDISNTYEIMEKYDFTKIAQNNGLFAMQDLLLKFMEDLNAAIFENDQVQELIQDDTRQFDVAILEYGNFAMFHFVERFKVPFIGVTTTEAPDFFHGLLGNPTHPVLYPDILLPFSEDLSFLERVTSTVVGLYLKHLQMKFLECDDELIDKYFGKNPPLLETAQRVDVMFINANPIMSNVRPVGPSTVYIGGDLHIEEVKPLPQDLQEFLDDAKEGVIYFSLGSNVKSKDLTDQTKQVIVEALGELPYKVLWKFEGEDLPGKPDNVKIVKWSPQQDVLRHPNVKVFITQGGLQSIDEAIYNKVPMVGMPFFGDQPNNVRKLVDKGICLSVDHFTIEKESFKTTILEVIENPKYRNRIEEMSNLILDQPMSGLEKAVWWTEYVIRHKGAKHLRSPLIDIPFYHYYFLDVIGFMSTIFLTFIVVIYKSFQLSFGFVKFVYWKVFSRGKEKTL